MYKYSKKEKTNTHNPAKTRTTYLPLSFNVLIFTTKRSLDILNELLRNMTSYFQYLFIWEGGRITSTCRALPASAAFWTRLSRGGHRSLRFSPVPTRLTCLHVFIAHNRVRSFQHSHCSSICIEICEKLALEFSAT